MDASLADRPDISRESAHKKEREKVKHLREEKEAMATMEKGTTAKETEKARATARQWEEKHQSSAPVGVAEAIASRTNVREQAKAPERCKKTEEEIGTRIHGNREGKR